jgi:hypothetical protein
MAVNDPAFGQIEYSGHAWDGLVPFEHGPSGTSEFAVHLWADESGPRAMQRATFEQIKARYSSSGRPSRKPCSAAMPA